MKRWDRKPYAVWQHDPRYGATKLFSGSREECERFVRDCVSDDDGPDVWIDGFDYYETDPK